MVTRKFLIATCVMTLVCIFGILNPGYAVSLANQDRPQPGAQSPAATALAEQSLGDEASRGGDTGFVTKAEHDGMVRFILSNYANPEITKTLSEQDGKYGEKIILQAMKGFRNTNEGRRAAGHFSIKGQMVGNRNVVYVTVDEDAYNANSKLAQHEIEEYIATADAAIEKANLGGQEISQQGLYDAKKALADWLDKEATPQAANDLLIGIHRSVPTQLGATERDLMPDTLNYLQSMVGLRAASGLGDQAPKEEIVVIDAAQVIANKTVFNDWLVKDGAKLSVAILAKSEEEYNGVMEYERYTESSVRVKVAARQEEDWMKRLEPDQIITINNPAEWTSLMEAIRDRQTGMRLNSLLINPNLAEAIAIGV